MVRSKNPKVLPEKDSEMVKPLRRLRALAGVLALATVFPAVLASHASASPDPKIVGGERVSIADYNYMVFLTRADGFQFCGGSLIAANKVLTAAHCSVNQDPAQVRVVAGREDKQSTDGVVANVTNIWVHPQYTTATAGFDVAVWTLDQNLDAYGTIEVVQGTDAPEYAEGSDATILGWGTTSSGGQASQYLLGAHVPLTSDDTCKTAYQQYDHSSMICAGLPEGGVDTCQGDSGGPMVVNGKEVGTTSWGQGCAQAGFPGVYGRVGTYYDDIMAQVGS